MAPETLKRAHNSVLTSAQILLRFLAVVFTITAISVMATSTQNVVVYGFHFTARYSYSSSMRFLFGTDVAVCVFSVLSLIVVWLLSRSESNPKNCFLLFLHDLVMMLLMISGCAAATGVGYVSKYGEEKMGWTAICDRVSKFCNKMTISLTFSYLAFFCYFGLVVVSSKKIIPGAIA